ncbi:ABC transporter ATP-binding protein [Arcanobacterium haemolyticum]|nr:ABC transporter ATP-binding protein [Arcanobacterium haemolyticum]
MALVNVRGVTRWVRLPDSSELHILRGVDLDVEAGERVSIVGRSGTGKSTLLNILGLLDKPNDGTYTVGDTDVLSLREGKRAALRGTMFGFVFQQFNIFSERTAQENVEVPLLYTSGTEFWRRGARAAEMLERVGLGDRLDSYPTEMSGGEQQRIAIARALVRKPRIILADEPTGALDPDTGRLVMELLEEVAHENNSALITITHDLNVAARADRVLSLYDGVLHRLEHTNELLTPAADALSVTAVMPQNEPGESSSDDTTNTELLSSSDDATNPRHTSSENPAYPPETLIDPRGETADISQIFISTEGNNV